MRAVVITEPGGPNVLEVQDVPDPSPAAGEVLVKVAAAALNRADILQRQGNYPPPPGASPYLGMEVSGTIAALGEDVAGWSVGDQVCALLSGGGYAELVAVPVGQLMTVPSGVTLVDAAALPEATCTVWSMVFGAEAGRLQPGERLLVHGGSSGIGTMAIQLAHAKGAVVFATAGSPRKVDFCRELGAAVAINYHEEAFEERIVIETEWAGVDVVLDNMGASYLEQGLRHQPHVAVLGSLHQRLPVLAFTVERYTAAQAADTLARHGVSVWSGPTQVDALLRSFGADEHGGACFIGLMPHTTVAEVDLFLDGLFSMRTAPRPTRV